MPQHKSQEDKQQVYRVEGGGRLLQKADEARLTEVLARTDAFLIGRHDVLRYGALLQHIARYVLHVAYTPNSCETYSTSLVHS